MVSKKQIGELMPTLKKYQLCLITHDLQQASIIKNIINDINQEKICLSVIGDISSINNIKDHIFLVDYKTIVTQKLLK